MAMLEGARAREVAVQAASDDLRMGAGDRRLALWLVGGAVVMLIGAGLALWARRGDAVFADWLLTAIAGCF